MASHSTRQAVVLATETSAAFSKDGRQVPLAQTRVGGITLLKRSLLTLDRQGIRRFAVVTAGGPDAERARAEAARDPQLQALDISWTVNEERPEDDGYSVLLGGQTLGDDFLVVPADRIFDPKIAGALVAARSDGTRLVVSRVVASGSSQSSSQSSFTGLMRGGRALMRSLRRREARRESMLLADVLTDFASADRLGVVDVEDAYVQVVRDPSSRKNADATLLRALRKPVDGLVARYVNRVFSLAVTRLLRNTPVTPNQITAVSFGVAALGGLTCAQATVAHPGWLVLGALLWQLASMLDGVDGELARLKFSGSSLGEWLDTLSDDMGRIVFFVGAGIGTSAVFGSSVWMVVLALCVVAQLGTSIPIYRKLLQTGSGSHFALDWNDPADQGSAWKRFKDRFGFFGRRDTYIAMWLIFALLGLLKVGIVLTATVTFFVLINELFSPRQGRGDVVAAERKPAGTVLTR